MRIAVVYHLPMGGALRALTSHVRMLLEFGHEIEVFRLRDSGQEWIDALGLKTVEIDPPQMMPSPQNAIEAYRRDMTWRRTYARDMDRAMKKLASAVSRSSFDILFANTCQNIQVPGVAKHLPNLPSVLYLQEPNRMLFEAGDDGLPWIGPAVPPRKLQHRLLESMRFHDLAAMARSELMNYRAFDRVLVNSVFSRDAVVRAYGGNPHVCYLGTAEPTELATRSTGESFVLCIGTLAEAKNPLLSIRAVAASRRFDRLVWVANNVDEALRLEAEALASTLGVQFDLRVRVSDEELDELYASCAVLLYAPRLEPFGYGPIEAAARSVPVVAIAEGGCLETVIDGVNGRLAAGTPEDLAAALDLPLIAASVFDPKWSELEAGKRLESHLLTTLAKS